MYHNAADVNRNIKLDLYLKRKGMGKDTLTGVGEAFCFYEEQALEHATPLGLKSMILFASNCKKFGRVSLFRNGKHKTRKDHLAC